MPKEMRNAAGNSMQPLKQDLTSSSASQPGLLAPDTTGMNFYRADPALTDLLKLHLPEALFRHIEPYLDRLGELAGGHLDECARLADRHTPVLHQRDKFGRDVQTIEYHPAYREIEKAAFGEFGIHALSIRKGIMGWPDKYPVVAKHAFTFLFNQTEFGMGCPINVTDGCAKLLNNFGSEALKAKYLDGLTQTDMSRLTQGGQFMTEKEGGSDVGTLTTRAVQEGDHWRLYGEKWFCSNADAKVVMLLARPEGAGPGTKGVGLFLMPRFLDDGSPNHYRIVRLKDKLGTRSMASGEVRLEGQPLLVRAPEDAIEAGIAYLTEDRKGLGLFLDLSCGTNINLGVIRRDARKGGILDLAAAKRRAEGAFQMLRVRAASPLVSVGSLSGGNQQKVLLSRWLETGPKVLILDEPTRGVDIGAKSEIYRIIDDLAKRGIGVVVISSELPEIIGVCDRVLVMREGGIAGEVGGPGGRAITQENIMAYGAGAVAAA